MSLKTQKWRFSESPVAFQDAVRSEQKIAASRKKDWSFEDHGFVDSKEAAAFLGIPLRSLYQYVQRGLLPSYKLGRHRLFRRHELVNTLRASAPATRDEILR